LKGRAVFCLAPHQDHFIAPVGMLAPIPDTVPPRRATLAANMETALNAHWDAATGPGDRIVVVGAGIVGLLVAAIAARIPATEVTVIDTDPSRAAIVTALGAHFELAPIASGVRLPAGESPVAADKDADVVFHTSASAAGLATAIGCAGMEGTVVELSWYGDKEIAVPLGGPFHSRRLRLISSQVGKVSGPRRERWSYRRRLEAALALLADPVLDALVTDEIAFDDTPRRLPEILAPGAVGLAPVIRYPGA
ncbi:MAG: zinc-binding alcohol dehydrogenase, partial [Hyphomicrobium sp.]